MTANRTSYVYMSLAGETAPGRSVKSGLYRTAVGDDRGELVTRHNLRFTADFVTIATAPTGPSASELPRARHPESCRSPSDAQGLIRSSCW
jgi:hypothetical protein